MGIVTVAQQSVTIGTYVSKIVSILLSKLNDCPLLCYCNYPFLTVCKVYDGLLKMGSYSSIMMCQFWDNCLIY